MERSKQLSVGVLGFRERELRLKRQAGRSNRDTRREERAAQDESVTTEGLDTSCRF